MVLSEMSGGNSRRHVLVPIGRKLGAGVALKKVERISGRIINPHLDHRRSLPRPLARLRISPSVSFISLIYNGSLSRPLPMGYPERLWWRICYGCTAAWLFFPPTLTDLIY